MTDNELSLAESRNQRARNVAMASLNDVQVTPTGLVKYESRGKVLVVGGEQAQWFATRLEKPLQAEVLLTDDCDELGVPTTPLAGRELKITGHLGAFRIEIGEKGKHNYQLIETDMVMDLGASPLLKSELPPPGYWYYNPDQDSLDAAWLELDGMVGTFEKPKYFSYDADRCAHARSGNVACTRCIDACPADAIISIGEQVQVNPNLCQGGGVCATVCPSGAMRYAYPKSEDTLNRIRKMLATYITEGGADPELVVFAENDANIAPLQSPNRLSLMVEELASVGLEVWLSALAYGARKVLLVKGHALPMSVKAALDEQLSVKDDILNALGYPSSAVSYYISDDDSGDEVKMPSVPLGTFMAFGNKRESMFFAIDHLVEHAPNKSSEVTLGSGAPFGTAMVDADSCTLCLSCVGVCPGKALHTGDEIPQLFFVENNCLQCGMCVSTCPEDAISISPRLLFDREERNKKRVLYEEEPFCCISCGTPFATHKTIGNILEKLAGHAMFQSDRAKNRLKMCEDCRVVDAVQDSDAMQASLGKQTTYSPDKGRS
jgi:ferredoxin